MRRCLGFLATMPMIVPVLAAAEAPTVEYIKAADAQFPYVEAGEGEPVLFVHGAFSDLRLWEPMREPVAEDHRFIAYTQRQFGTETWPEEPGFARDVHEEDLVALLEAWDDAMHLVGWSYSGPVVLQAALDRPELVRSVVIFEPSIREFLVGDPQYEETLATWGQGWEPVIEATRRGAPVPC